MVHYSAKAARALGFLKRHGNDIEIYVEDTANRAMWLKFLTSIMPPGSRMRSINMLGGRTAVVEACRLDQADDGRKRIYITDGDYDFLIGKRKKSLRHLYRLDAYCIENLFIEEHSVTSVAGEALVNATDVDISSAVNFQGYLSECARLLKPLFIVYATAYSLDRSIQTVGFSVTGLLSKGGTQTLDSRKVAARARSIARDLSAKFGREAYRAERKRISQRSDQLELRHCVSGKDYLFPILWLRLKVHCAYRGTDEQLKVQLARHPSGNAARKLRNRFLAELRR